VQCAPPTPTHTTLSGGHTRSQMCRGAVHVAAVGDFDARELEQSVLLYLGSIHLHPEAVPAAQGAAGLCGAVRTVEPVAWGPLGACRLPT
jgi:hypothetical protein